MYEQLNCYINVRHMFTEAIVTSTQCTEKEVEVVSTKFFQTASDKEGGRDKRGKAKNK